MENTQGSLDIWCIEDTLFYPLGLINHTTGSKTVFVTWNHKHLINFVFKMAAQRASGWNKFMISISDEIVDIIILEVNTLVLLQNGNVSFFSSIKSIHQIPWLSSGVRCISQSLEGFSLIRIQGDKRISLEIYKDVANMGKIPQQALHSFDVTFDERNLFDSDWVDDKFTLISLKVTERNKTFLELLTGKVVLDAREVHIFSISNGLFALHTNVGEGFEIKSLAPQASTVDSLKFLPSANMLLIFLSCGVIEVWYLSKIVGIIERYTYVNGSEFVHHTFSGEVLYFTDEHRVCRLTFRYDDVEHTCRVTEHCIDAPGMVAVTYEALSGQLVCLSNNNVFFYVSFDEKRQEDKVENPNNSAFFELTKEKTREMMSKSQFLSRVKSLPANIDKRIEEEYKKQELIAVCRKSAIYSQLIVAELSFSQHIPETKERLIYPGDGGIPAFTYFAVVSVKVLPHEIFKSTVWNLMITHSSQVRLLRITPELLSATFNVLVPIVRKPGELIPEFSIQLLAHVNLQQDFVCINIPVKVQSFDVKKLLSRNQGLRALTKESACDRPLISFQIIAPNIHLSQVQEMFDCPPIVDEPSQDDIFSQTLYFLGEELRVVFTQSTKRIALESCDPVAILYAKFSISKYLWDNLKQTTDDYEELQRNILELQCQVERKYGTLIAEDLHLTNLKRVYESLRKDIIWTH